MSKATFPEVTGNESQKPLQDGALLSSDMRNTLSALFQGDLAALRPRAQATPNMTVAVNPSIIQNFFKQVNRSKQPVYFAGGNSPTVTSPTTNPRIDILYLNNSDALAWVVGAESSSPTANWAGMPDDAIPICTVYCRAGISAIYNFEDRNANPQQGFIFEDVRPFATMGGGSGKEIKDADGDTKIQVEESADEDKIRMDTAGVERVLVDSNGITLKSGSILNSQSTPANLIIENKDQDKDIILKINDGGVTREAFKILGDTGIINMGLQSFNLCRGGYPQHGLYDAYTQLGAGMEVGMNPYSEVDRRAYEGYNNSVATNKLIDSGANFPSDIGTGWWCMNYSSKDTAIVTARDSATQLSLGSNIFPSTGANYCVYRVRVTLLKGGIYLVLTLFNHNENSGSSAPVAWTVRRNGADYYCSGSVYTNPSPARGSFAGFHIGSYDAGDYFEPMMVLVSATVQGYMKFGLIKIG